MPTALRATAPRTAPTSAQPHSTPPPPHRAVPARHAALVHAALLAATASCTSAPEPAPSQGMTTGACAVEADCAPFEDGDACNGRSRCDLATLRCAIDASSIVACDPAQDDACRAAACQPHDGQCLLRPRADGVACDDGAPCTFGDHCVAGACAPGTDLCLCRSDADCPDDADLCNGVPYCDQATPLHACAIKPGSVVTCPDSDDGPCKAAACTPATGACALAARPDKTPCEDGALCTVGDHCLGGACAPGPSICPCAVNADCPDDADLCNGKPFCDPQAHTCKANPATVVTCDASKDTACVHATCAPAKGTCSPQPAPLGSLCDDGDACTANDFCVAGACQKGAGVCACANDAECLAKDDGDLCNGVPYCDKSDGACKLNPATVVACPTVNDSACAKNVCQPATGACAVHPRAEVVEVCAIVAGVAICGYALPAKGAIADGGPFACQDGDPCTQGDQCKGGTCAPGTKTCACSSNADCAKLDDGDLCNGTLYCHATADKGASCVINPATVVNCPSVDDGACQKNLCQPKTGACAPTAVVGGAPCDDGNACTVGDACKLGSCAPGTFTCACAVDADCADSDGDPCTGVPYCDKSGSKPQCLPNPASAISCSPKDDTACLVAKCSPKTGKCSLQPLAAGTPCDDGKLCTVAEACAANGSCGGGKTNPCDDGDPCTQDACASASGCSHKPLVCSDGNSCTTEACDAKTGKCSAPVKVQAGQLCNADGNGCTAGDACNVQGSCVAGAAVVCSPAKDPCQQAVCQSQLAGDGFVCAPVAVADGTPCDDGKTCNLGSSCSAGSCAAGKVSRLFASVVGPTTGEQALTALLVHANGSVTVGGWQRGSNGVRRTWLVRTDAFGAVQAQWTAPASKDSAVVTIRGIFETEADETFAIGTELDATGLPAAVVRRFGPGLTLQLTKTHRLASGMAEEVVAARKYKKDTYAMVMQPTDPAAPTKVLAPHVMRVDASGVASSMWHDFGPQTPIRAVAGQLMVPFDWAFDDGPRWSVVGQLGDQVGAGGWSGGGKLRGMGRFTAAVDSAVTVLASSELAAGIKLQMAWISSIHFNGLALLDVDSGFLVRDSVEVGGRIIAVGERNGVGEILGVDAAGNKVQATPLQLPAPAGSHSLTAVALADLGGVFAVGSQLLSDGTRRALLVRANAFGHTSCAAAGACAELEGADCVDGKPCTLDGCDAGVGCKFAPQASYCIASEGCTRIGTCSETGICKQSGPPRLFASAQTLPAAAQGFGVFLGDDAGGSLFAASDGALYARKLDGTGTAVGSDSNETKLCSALSKTSALSADPLDDKPAVQRLGLDSKGNGVYCIRRITVLAAAPVLQATVAPPCTGCVPSPRQILRQIDGGHVLVGGVQGGGDGVQVTRLNASGASMWKLHHVAPGLSLAVAGMAQLATLDGFVVGSAGPSLGNLDRAFALGVSEGGKSTSFNTYVGGVERALAAAAQLTPMSAIAGGTLRVNGTIRSPWLLILDGAGKTLGEWVAPPEAAPAGIGTLTVAGGVTYWAGSALVNTGTGITIGAHAANLQPLWRRDMPMAVTRVLPFSLHRVEGDLVLAATAALVGDPMKSLVAVRASAWGHTNCATSGSCGAPAKVCDDGNPCTADVCEAATGCGAIALSGVACAGGGSCVAGVCK